MATIPHLRQMLSLLALQIEHGTIAPDHAANRIRWIVTELHRRPQHVTRGRISARLTPQVVASIHQLRANNPAVPQLAIARALNIPGGRVSEVLHGKRT